MANEWHYTKNGQQHGPVPAATLKQLAENGDLHPDDLVWQEGWKQWAAAKSVKGLFAPHQSSPAREAVAEPLPQIQINVGSALKGIGTTAQGVANSEPVKAATAAIHNAAGQAVTGIGNFVRSDAVQSQVNSAKGMWESIPTQYKIIAACAGGVGLLLMFCIVGRIGSWMFGGGGKGAPSASRSTPSVKLPDFSKIDYSKGPNGEKPKPFILYMVRQGDKYVEAETRNNGKGIMVVGDAIDLPDGQNAYHGKIKWDNTDGYAHSPILLDVALSMILRGKGEMTFNAGRPHGRLTYWHENGQKWMEVSYVKGKRQGTAHVWHDNGAKQFDMKFVDDLRQGAVVEYYADGPKMLEGAYKDDHRDGVWTEWQWHKGKAHKVFEGKYAKGNGVGTHRRWYAIPAGGNLENETPFVDGEKHGVERGYWPAALAGDSMIPAFTRTWKHGEAIDAKNYPKPY
jgi:antitoxin component YwqK of YwqJK toxin-antitoxin module